MNERDMNATASSGTVDVVRWGKTEAVLRSLDMAVSFAFGLRIWVADMVLSAEVGCKL